MFNKTAKRRFIAVLTLFMVTILVCSGCSKIIKNEINESVGDKISNNFKSSGLIRCRETTSKINLERNDNVISLTFCGDDMLNGMKFVLDTKKDSTSAEFKDVNIPIPKEANTLIGIVSRIFDALDEKENTEMTEKDGVYVISPRNNKDFFITADKKDCKLISISVPSVDLEVNFESFEYTSVSTTESR